MRDRKSRNTEEQKPTNALRRSPRFLRENQIGVENPGTPKPAARKLRATDSFSTPRGSSITKTQKNGDGILQNGERKGCRRSARLHSGANFSSLDLQKKYVMEKMVTRSSVCGSRFVSSQDNECDEISGKGDREVTELKNSEKSGKGSRRSARLGGRVNMSKSEEVLFPQKQSVIEKRVTRSSVHGKKVVIYEVSESDSEEDSGERVRFLSKDGKAKVGVDFCRKNIGNIEKRVTRSSSQTEKASNVPTTSPQEVAMSDKMKPEGDDELSKLYRSKRDVKDCGITMRNGDKNSKRKTYIGEKRKRCRVEEECEIVEGWTKEQELALQKAYFTAKPTPQFWKKVARMVMFHSRFSIFYSLA